VDKPADMPATVEFLDRDLCWLEFNRRVLHEATDWRTPLLERVTFLGIFNSNLDEFFMKRTRRMMRRFAADSTAVGLAELRERLVPMLAEQARCFREDLIPALAENNILLLSWSQLEPHERESMDNYFLESVFPVLTPQTVDPGHPFPFMSNLSTSLALALDYPETGERLFARVKVPKLLPQWIELSPESSLGARRFVRLRDIIQNNLDHLFPGMTVLDVMPIRVTRNAEVEYEGDPDDDLLEIVEEELRMRRLQQVVRLEHGPNANPWLLDMVVGQLNLMPEQVFEVRGELDYTDLKKIASLKLPELRYPPWTPTVPNSLIGDRADMFSLIRNGDVLVHHPYESFDASVSRFIRAAVEDENVVAIKLTVYRTSDDSPFVPLLIQAAEAGKQVACLVELKARFDEQRNIRWANALENAGVHVVYGMVGVKTHTKTAIVVRREADGLRCYAHIGTGNYNPQTAKLYTDLGLFTCRPDVAGDVIELFHYLTGRSLKRDYRKLLVAPVTMRGKFIEMIEREQQHHEEGRPARIVAKMNQLEDPDVCRALYRASQAGLPIDCIVRGFCVLRPGLPELSPTIRVLSIIGRFLEHSRIFFFQNGEEDPVSGEYYIGSADWMRRNLNDRVEAVTPVEDRSLRERLWEILELSLQDERQAWEMHPDGSYTQRAPGPDTPPMAAAGSQQVLMERAIQRNGLPNKVTAVTAPG